MSYLEAAWDGSVEGVSGALRAGVHAGITMPVSDLGILDTPLLINYICTSHRDSFHAATIHNIHNFNTLSYIMRDTCAMYKTGEEHSNQ